MTEEAKQTMLRLFQELLRQGQPELELLRLQGICDQLLHDLSQEVDSDLKNHLLTSSEQLLRLLKETRLKLAHTARIITYIEQTPAAALTRDAVLQID